MPDTKVLFVVPSLQRAGAESQLVALVNGLPADQFEKHLLYYRPGSDLASDLQNGDVAVHVAQRKGKLDVSLGRSIASIIDKHKIDVVHCTLLNALVFGLLGRFFAKRKPAVVSVIHTTKSVDKKHQIVDAVLHRQFMKRCRQIWFVSSRQAEQWMQRMPFIERCYRVIHNGIDTNRFDPDLFESGVGEFRRTLGIAAHEKVLCSVAGFRPEKLHRVLIEAFALVRSRGVNCRLLLAGEGPMESDLRALVAELQLEDFVLFLGPVADVRPLLAASDCKVLASAAETFSMAMLESMSMRVPVISTEVGGAGEAIEDGESGFLVPANDINKLAETICDVLGDDGKRERMGVAARESILSRFRLELMIGKSKDCLLKAAQSG